MMIPLKQQFSGSEFFLEKVRANCLTTEQRQVWVLGIPFLGEDSEQAAGTMIQHVLIIRS